MTKKIIYHKNLLSHDITNIKISTVKQGIFFAL